MTTTPKAIDPASDIVAYLKQHEHKELLRFITCGSVDDGKSTLIGRLLYDSKMIFEDQLAAVKKDSARFGTTGDDFDPALLTDGLRAEREQGITIDVAYRYFNTPKRKFIIADTPGHEQYTRNMATGASTANLAIILIDARHGVLTQTKRHSFIASLLGIQHIVVAINKMDLVDFSEDTYNRIVEDYREFAGKLELSDIRFVPLSALKGDNVVDASPSTPWYTGGTLMHNLENVHIASDRNFIDFRFPVQYVNRPNLDFRGFTGTLAAGTVRPGDDVMVLPSRKTTRIDTITTFDGDLDEAFPPMAVTLTTADEVDISRGDMIVHPGNVPDVASDFDAMLVWMAETPMNASGSYLIKHTTHTVNGRITDTRYRIDVNTMHKHDADRLELNEIGRVRVRLAKPIAFDPYKKVKGTGAFIVIDKLTNNTVAAGMILDMGPAKDPAGVDHPQSQYVRRKNSPVSAEDRHLRLGQNPRTVWLTGLTGSGKAAIAYALEQRLHDLGKHAHVLDGGNTRLGLNMDLAFSGSDRAENVRRAAEVARLFNDAGLLAICSFTSPYGSDRGLARKIVNKDLPEAEAAGGERFIEVHLDCDLDTCKQRMPEVYEKAESGEIEFFPGVSSPYEEPQNPDLKLDTAHRPIEESVDKIIAKLRETGALE